MGMHDIASQAERISGHSVERLQEMLYTVAPEPQPQIYAVKTIAVPFQRGLYQGTSHQAFQAK